MGARAEMISPLQAFEPCSSGMSELDLLPVRVRQPPGKGYSELAIIERWSERRMTGIGDCGAPLAAIFRYSRLSGATPDRPYCSFMTAVEWTCPSVAISWALVQRRQGCG